MSAKVIAFPGAFGSAEPRGPEFEAWVLVKRLGAEGALLVAHYIAVDCIVAAAADAGLTLHTLPADVRSASDEAADAVGRLQRKVRGLPKPKRKSRRPA